MTQSIVDQNQIVFGYWATRGIAEPSRMILKYTKTPFIDKLYVQGDAPVYSRDEWYNEMEELELGRVTYRFSCF